MEENFHIREYTGKYKYYLVYCNKCDTSATTVVDGIRCPKCFIGGPYTIQNKALFLAELNKLP